MTTVESLYPVDLVQSVGHVVMFAAWVEDKAGELIQLVAMTEAKELRVPVKGWAASGAALVTELRRVTNNELADRLGAALELRNDVVHGVFLSGDIFADAQSGEEPTWASMKRKLGRVEPAQYAFKNWDVASLNAPF
jgi:hypothetical protein